MHLAEVLGVSRMIPDQLKPRLELLHEEYVLVQAWKKTASYIRYHNWFSDTLALDLAAVNLPTFLGELRERLRFSEAWRNDRLRIVPAPKSERWRVQEMGWKPIQERGVSARIRPLAYASLADQVVATALMLCLADRVETRQGDPRQSVRDQGSRTDVVSYGNRLFCDSIGEKLVHRWGSAKLYRGYFQDYRKFLSRPEVAAESIAVTASNRVYVVHADLRQFYDRVSPDLLASAIDSVRRPNDDPGFFSLAASVLDWGWDRHDEEAVQNYAEQAGLEDFTRVALPQGLVASGFFANVVLLSFDDALRAAIGSKISPRIRVVDACRYVDDMRILIEVIPQSDGSSEDIVSSVSDWLNQLLDENASGLSLSPEKTDIAALGGNDRPLVRQSAKMSRIQAAVSGGFDARGGEEILDAIRGLMRAQEALSLAEDSSWRFSPIPDVRDETVARFAAARYRTTFRSIRPLLQEDGAPDEFEVGLGGASPFERLPVVRTRHDLDEDARAFALDLIKRWVEDPSNVRLLRVGLDLWPDVEVLREILSLLRPYTDPYTEKSGCPEWPRRVAWYCLAEVLRAGATETGLVGDNESLPSGIDLDSYRDELRKEAVRLVKLPSPRIPWYVRQQALLFLAALNAKEAPVIRNGIEPETRNYQDLIRFLRGEGEAEGLQDSDFATLAVVARRAFVDRSRAVELTLPGLTLWRMLHIAQKDPSFCLELSDADTGGSYLYDLPLQVRDYLCRSTDSPDDDRDTLANLVLKAHPRGKLRNELSLLRFASAFLKQWKRQTPPPDMVTPVQVTLRLDRDQEVADVKRLWIGRNLVDTSGSLYEVPAWCKPGERWRFQLGFLLRFILSGQPDFTRPVRGTSLREIESFYRPAESHWYQRLYGMYSGQPAFGDDWLPITDWAEGFLLALLRWPGCRTPDGFDWINQGVNEAKKQIRRRIATLNQGRGSATRVLILPLSTKRPTPTNGKRPLRACVVQTAIPSINDIHDTDLELSEPSIRRRHRNHLSAALAAVKRMLALRETHQGTGGGLDWLILPELAVHPDDIQTHLVPFARAYKSVILAGLTYQEILLGQPLVNSALWVFPEWSDMSGLQIRTRRQGKAHLAPNEQLYNDCGKDAIQGFRPCQWLISYPWSDADADRPVWLTAAVCYDATDLGLAADLKDVSDILAIPALNKDVKTFDQMALALHYHMFQLVVVANSGQYGGSNAYWPKSDAHIRQVFHTHGQPQASISFLEIGDIGAFLDRHATLGANAEDWKHPPAGMNIASSGGSS